MIELFTIIQIRNTSLLFLAPPAWGKTRMIHELVAAGKGCRFIYVSPLRALANEFYESTDGGWQLLKSSKDLLEGQEKLNLVLTPEIFNSILYRDKIGFDSRVVVIVDEVHLFYIWGESFREELLNFMENTMSLEVSVLFLTATMNLENFKKYSEHVRLNFQNNFVMNLGNQKFQFSPRRTHEVRGWSKKGYQAFLKTVIPYIIKNGRAILFVRYRREVDSWLEWASRKKILALGCRGGEVERFSKEMKVGEPDFLVATSVLSHGVNLPPLSYVLLGYEEEDYDILLQMMARGGRDGNYFEVIMPGASPFEGLRASLIYKLKIYLKSILYAVTGYYSR